MLDQDRRLLFLHENYRLNNLEFLNFHFVRKKQQKILYSFFFLLLRYTYSRSTRSSSTNCFNLHKKTKTNRVNPNILFVCHCCVSSFESDIINMIFFETNIIIISSYVVLLFTHANNTSVIIFINSYIKHKLWYMNN